MNIEEILINLKKRLEEIDNSDILKECIQSKLDYSLKIYEQELEKNIDDVLSNTVRMQMKLLVKELK